MQRPSPKVVVRLEAAGRAERPARAAVVLVLDDGHGSEIPPVPAGGRGAAGAQAERTVLAVLAVVGRRAVLAHAKRAAEAQARGLELLPARTSSESENQATAVSDARGVAVGVAPHQRDGSSFCCESGRGVSRTMHRQVARGVADDENRSSSSSSSTGRVTSDFGLVGTMLSSVHGAGSGSMQHSTRRPFTRPAPW